ncbi:hypothetical protein PSECIP111951_02501 [Pseudoalteromonas holothuriae]|uniref:Uncharacterized protein n=1 Tax=Pseudoalteromonas holothuriae TaxID=2963714 RepID=A0ABN8URB3_9GAMM|nr:hypothetical protein [Pseudoalteromonas sp. CIP111951]CAH9061493.1 hypothetical protein PSECIP111951_02501 [Pseudoalteromonas sp. CIP111951]
MSTVSHASAPQGWQGYYKGECELITPKRGSFNRFAMALEVTDVNDQKADWVITYGEGKMQQVRNYTLQSIDKSLGHYAIDENNGIVIDQYLVGNEFMSLFEIGSSKIQATYTLDTNGTLDVSMETFTFDPIREKKVGPYTVANYALKVKQKCRLFKW